MSAARIPFAVSETNDYDKLHRCRKRAGNHVLAARNSFACRSRFPVAAPNPAGRTRKTCGCPWRSVLGVASWRPPISDSPRSFHQGYGAILKNVALIPVLNGGEEYRCRLVGGTHVEARGHDFTSETIREIGCAATGKDVLRSASLWRIIPADRYKTKRPNVVTLFDAARNICPVAQSRVERFQSTFFMGSFPSCTCLQMRWRAQASMRMLYCGRPAEGARNRRSAAVQLCGKMRPAF